MRSWHESLYGALVTSPDPNVLARVPLFADLEPRDLKGLANSFNERTFAAGDTILTAGSGGVGFFVIGEGTATVSVNGREVATLGPGEYFGEVALIDGGGERSASVTAQTELKTYGLTAWAFRPIVESNAAIAWKLLQALARKLREAENRAAPAA